MPDWAERALPTCVQVNVIEARVAVRLVKRGLFLDDDVYQPGRALGPAVEYPDVL